MKKNLKLSSCGWPKLSTSANVQSLIVKFQQVAAPFSTVLGSRIIHTLFLEFLSLHHRPRRCSCPTPANSVSPLLEKANAFTKPTCGEKKRTLNTSCFKMLQETGGLQSHGLQPLVHESYLVLDMRYSICSSTVQDIAHVLLQHTQNMHYYRSRTYSTCCTCCTVAHIEHALLPYNIQHMWYRSTYRTAHIEHALLPYNIQHVWYRMCCVCYCNTCGASMQQRVHQSVLT